MSFRFWRRIRIAPGVTLNLSRSAGSLSFGPRGAKLTVGTRGRRATVGIPGTGLFYTATPSGGRARRRPAPSPIPGAPPRPPREPLTLGFFKRLVTPDDEEAFVDGCRELALGHEDRALEHLQKAVHLADGAYLAGFLSLKRKRLPQARGCLMEAERKRDRLGHYFSRYGITATMSLRITDEVSARVGPDLRGVLLGLVEVHQLEKRPQDAIECLQRLRRLEPDDVVVKLSLAELLLEARREDREACRKVIRLAEAIENETPIHTALLLYKARALRALGLMEAARECLTVTLRGKSGRPEDLLRALRYERALVYQGLGQRRRARRALEKLYAEDPDYEDVASRLGL
ncbi:MAG: DUF4236 domain-containing protein [Gemmatimonadota bacterium]